MVQGVCRAKLASTQGQGAFQRADTRCSHGRPANDHHSREKSGRRAGRRKTTSVSLPRTPIGRVPSGQVSCSPVWCWTSDACGRHRAPVRPHGRHLKLGRLRRHRGRLRGYSRAGDRPCPHDARCPGGEHPQRCWTFGTGCLRPVAVFHWAALSYSLGMVQGVCLADSWQVLQVPKVRFSELIRDASATEGPQTITIRREKSGRRAVDGGGTTSDCLSRGDSPLASSLRTGHPSARRCGAGLRTHAVVTFVSDAACTCRHLKLGRLRRHRGRSAEPMDGLGIM